MYSTFLHLLSAHPLFVFESAWLYETETDELWCLKMPRQSHLVPPSHIPGTERRTRLLLWTPLLFPHVQRLTAQGKSQLHTFKSWSYRWSYCLFGFWSDTVHWGDGFLITVSMVLLNITWILLPSGKRWGPRAHCAHEAYVWIPETRSPHQVSCVVSLNHSRETIAIIWPYCIAFFSMKYIKNVNGNFI